MSIEIDTSKIKYQGFIEKEGFSVRSWKTRYFAICDTVLYYFKDQEFKEKLGSIPLIDCTITYEEPVEGQGYYYSLHFPPSTGAKRTQYNFRAQTPEERDNWIREILKANKTTVFERPLSVALTINPANPTVFLPIPYFFYKAINYLNKNALDIEGIYRLNGSSTQIEALQNRINNNLDITFNDPHVTTGLIKLYMRTAPDPLMLKDNFEHLKLISSDQSIDDDKRVELLKPIVRSLPIPNYILIHFLFKHFIELLKHEEKTKMDPRNLAICIGPSLIKCDDSSTKSAVSESQVQQTIAMLIFNHFEEFFGTNPLMTYGSNGTGDIYTVKMQLDGTYPYTVAAPVGSVVQSVAEDETGWMICVWDNKWGVYHKSQVEKAKDSKQILKGLAPQSQKWILPPEIVNRMNEKCPEASQLYNALSTKLNELRTKAGKY